MEDPKFSFFRFHGSLAVPMEGSSEFSATIRFPKWDPTALTVDLLWLGNENERRRGTFALTNIGRNHVWLNSVDPRQGPVELLGIDKVRTSSFGPIPHSSSVRVAAVQIGIAEDKCEESRIFDVIVRLQPSGILCLPSIHSQNFTGEVHVQRIESGEVELELDNAVLKASETFEYYETHEDGNSVTHQVQRASLIGNVTVNPGVSLFEVHENLKVELIEVCTALSLCYRQPVDYYEIEYIGNNNKNSPWRSIFRRRWNSIKTKTSGDDLINTRALVNGGLQRILVSIKASPRALDIRRAIKFIAASYTATTEAAYFMAFSAMETILSCCLERPEELVLGASQWKKIQSTIRQAIQHQIPDDIEVRTGLYDKLPELQRITLSRRVIKACQKYRPKTEDLWPNISFEEGIKRAAQIRNGLFHAADVSVEDSIGKDILRVRTFAERLLLKLLSWPDEAIWIWYDQDLKWANQGDRRPVS